MTKKQIHPVVLARLEPAEPSKPASPDELTTRPFWLLYLLALINHPVAVAVKPSQIELGHIAKNMWSKLCQLLTYTNV